MRFRNTALQLASGLVVAGIIASCSGPANNVSRVDPKYGVSASPRVADTSKPIPKGGGSYKVGNPYTVAGTTYTPREQPNLDKVGIASWYGDDFHGRLTANGEVYDMNSFSAAHPTLPLPSYVRVTNLENRRSVVVRVNDRGPYAHDRVIDLSKRAANVLDFHNQGLAQVRVQYVGPAPLEGDDSAWLTASVRMEDGATPTTLLAATLPQAPSIMPESRPINAFAASEPTPRVGVGEVYSPQRRRGVFSLLTGYSAADRTADSIDAAFAVFDNRDTLSLPAAFKPATH
ncbi:MAG: septal ring lytic transglycosylase RlpA family protein [Rhodobiaceae bacterium]|nr:septal ring lytic transglycosylase RlpA family protein [Rhodobiaceae bacterium]MCC0057348.1 septal ring lytic transglycosylase RlpA family protein [Rhodobiaceae bacterium]